MRLARHVRTVRRPARRVAASVLAAAALSGPALLSGPADALAPAPTGIVFGAVGDAAHLETVTGRTLARHTYSKFDQTRIPDAAMLTVKARNSWKVTAAAAPGSTLHNHIVRWADTLKSRSKPVMVAFHHEPEAGASSSFGTATEYIAAYRKVVSIFRARGATNVIWVWQMTDWAFRAPSTSKVYAPKWYPGNDYVDVVGADAYNWYTCGAGRGKWIPLKTLMDPVIAFAAARGKQASLPEFAAHADPRRAAWLQEAQAYLAANDEHVAAAFYYQDPPMNPANADCVWKLGTEAEFGALGAIAGSAPYTTSLS